MFRYRNIAIIFLVAIFFILDRILKQASLGLGSESTFQNLVGNWLSFGFTPNYYIAFSLPLSGFWLNVSIGLFIIGLIFFLFYYFFKRNFWENILLLTIILGAISNYWDRWQYGFVIDYLAIKYFSVLNLADIMISLGAILLLFLNLKPRPKLK
ncbi:MAG: signal peptidase II [Planctomycetes bacterium]|jgi:signal peptidase II|nr:signal peptidase II [Planctomycetota bacterium]